MLTIWRKSQVPNDVDEEPYIEDDDVACLDRVWPPVWPRHLEGSSGKRSGRGMTCSHDRGKQDEARACGASSQTSECQTVIFRGLTSILTGLRFARSNRSHKNIRSKVNTQRIQKSG